MFGSGRMVTGLMLGARIAGRRGEEYFSTWKSWLPDAPSSSAVVSTTADSVTSGVSGVGATGSRHILPRSMASYTPGEENSVVAGAATVTMTEVEKCMEILGQRRTELGLDEKWNYPSDDPSYYFPDDDLPGEIPDADG